MYEKESKKGIFKKFKFKFINTFITSVKARLNKKFKNNHNEGYEKTTFNDLKLKTKLTISFTSLILLFIIPISISLNNFNNTAEVLSKTNEITIPEIYLAESVAINLKAIEKNLYASILTDNITKKEDYSDNSNLLYIEMITSLTDLEKFLVSDRDKVKNVTELLSKEETIRNEVINLKYKSDATRLIFNSYQPIVNNINKNLDEITESINSQLRQDADASNKSVKFSIILTLSITLAAILLGFVITKIITNSIVTPISEIECMAKALSDGNLKYKIKYKSKNEIGKLAENIEHSMSNLTLYINEINDVMNELSKGNLNVKISQKFSGDFEQIEHSITKSLNMLSNTLKNINDLSSEVSKKSKNISSVVQINSSSADKAAEASKILFTQSNKLNELVRGFSF